MHGARIEDWGILSIPSPEMLPCGIEIALETFMPRKKKVIARLYGVQRNLSVRPSASLIELENNLHLELGKILD